MFNFWKIKEEHSQTAGRIMYISAGISFVVSMLLARHLSYDLIDLVISISVIYILVSYIVLGWFRCYRTIRYKGHRVLRFAALVFMAVLVVYQMALLLYGECDLMEFMIGMVICVPFLLASVQCVRNGYIN